MSNVSQERRSEADELMEKCLEILAGSRRVYEQVQLLVAERDMYKAALELIANMEPKPAMARAKARKALEGGSSK
jgi:hypothetical protein